MKQISLTQGQFATVDDEDFEWLNQWTWYAVHEKPFARCKRDGTFYAIRATKLFNDKNSTVPMHRQILGLKPGDRRKVKHINEKALDNRRCNLKIVSTRRSRLKDLCDKYV